MWGVICNFRILVVLDSLDKGSLVGGLSSPRNHHFDEILVKLICLKNQSQRLPCKYQKLLKLYTPSYHLISVHALSFLSLYKIAFFSLLLLFFLIYIEEIKRLHQIQVRDGHPKLLASLISIFSTFPSPILVVWSFLVCNSLPKPFLLPNYLIYLPGSLHASPFSPNPLCFMCRSSIWGVNQALFTTTKKKKKRPCMASIFLFQHSHPKQSY